MKKYYMLVASMLTVIGLSGCGGGGSSNPPGNLTTLFLVDDRGFSYGGIPYKCDSMYDWEVTRPNGEFTFSPPDNCVFDFDGYFGTDSNDLSVPYNEYIYITDDLDNGVNNIPYECERFSIGIINHTYNDGIWNGAFDYNADDSCVFYF